MNRYTLADKNNAPIEDVGSVQFSAPLPDIGHTIVIPTVGRFRVLDVEHRACKQAAPFNPDEACFLMQLVVIVEIAP